MNKPKLISPKASKTAPRKKIASGKKPILGKERAI